MIAAILAAAAVGAPLNLELACPGQYRATESHTPYQDAYGRPLSQPLSMDTTVARQGTARIVLHGDSGRIAFPGGRDLQLVLLSQDDDALVAQYERPILFAHLTWRVHINRITGEMRVIGGIGGRQTGFAGTCAPVSTERKF